MTDKLARLKVLYKENYFPDTFDTKGGSLGSQMEYSLMHFLEMPDNYEFVYDFCIQKGFNLIVDIGCAFGFQSELFLNTQVAYVGLDHGNPLHYFWNEEEFLYIEGEYPDITFEGVFTKERDKALTEPLAVSILALGWPAYMQTPFTLHAQITALAEDFKHCLLYIPNDIAPMLEDYFLVVQLGKKGDRRADFYYLLNKDPSVN